jgi:hypothetical protein
MTDAERDVYDLLRQNGLSHNGAVAVMGNVRQESFFNPHAWGDQHTSYGLFQWRSSRLDHLLRYARERGEPIDSPNTQVGFAIREMKELPHPSGGSLYDYLKRTDNPVKAAMDFGAIFERPARVETARARYADEYARSGLAGGKAPKLDVQGIGIGGGQGAKGRDFGAGERDERDVDAVLHRLETQKEGEGIDKKPGDERRKRQERMAAIGGALGEILGHKGADRGRAETGKKDRGQPAQFAPLEPQQFLKMPSFEDAFLRVKSQFQAPGTQPSMPQSTTDGT